MSEPIYSKGLQSQTKWRSFYWCRYSKQNGMGKIWSVYLLCVLRSFQMHGFAFLETLQWKGNSARQRITYKTCQQLAIWGGHSDSHGKWYWLQSCLRQWNIVSKYMQWENISRASSTPQVLGAAVQQRTHQFWHGGFICNSMASEGGLMVLETSRKIYNDTLRTNTHWAGLYHLRVYERAVLECLTLWYGCERCGAEHNVGL